MNLITVARIIPLLTSMAQDEDAYPGRGKPNTIFAMSLLSDDELDEASAVCTELVKLCELFKSRRAEFEQNPGAFL